MTIMVFSSRPDCGQVLDQGGQGRVHHFAVVPHGGEVVAVRVEAAAVDLDEANALLDQSAGQQSAAAELVVAVALEDFGLLAC